MNRALSTFNWGSIEITLTVPLTENSLYNEKYFLGKKLLFKNVIFYSMEIIGILKNSVHLLIHRVKMLCLLKMRLY